MSVLQDRETQLRNFTAENESFQKKKKVHLKKTELYFSIQDLTVVEVRKLLVLVTVQAEHK